MADSSAASRRARMLGKTDLLIEVYQTSQRADGREAITRHGAVYVATDQWRERLDPALSRGHYIGRAVKTVDLAFQIGCEFADKDYLDYLDLFVPGVVEGLIIQALYGLADVDDTDEHRVTPVVTRILTNDDLQSTTLAPEGLRMRLLMPDYTTARARANKPPVWHVYLCESLIGKVERLLGSVTPDGFVPNEPEPVEQGALLRRVSINEAAEQAAPAHDPAFDAFREMNTDFWSGIGDLLAKL